MTVEEPGEPGRRGANEIVVHSTVFLNLDKATACVWCGRDAGAIVVFLGYGQHRKCAAMRGVLLA